MNNATLPEEEYYNNEEAYIPELGSMIVPNEDSNKPDWYLV